MRKSRRGTSLFRLGLAGVRCLVMVMNSLININRSKKPLNLKLNSPEERHRPSRKPLG